MEVTLPDAEATELQAWNLLFDLRTVHPKGWILVGAQMVVVHAARYQISRPVRTDDTDVLVDIRALRIREVAKWLQAQGLELEGVSADGIGHRFVRAGVSIDLLSIDHSGGTDNRLTLPPARTIEVPGGRHAINRAIQATLHIGEKTGTVPIPDWIGALVLKARAATAIPDVREKHLRDLALLLGLPVDLPTEVGGISGQEQKRIRKGAELITEEIWAGIRSSIDPRNAQAALSRLLGETRS